MKGINGFLNKWFQEKLNVQQKNYETRCLSNSLSQLSYRVYQEPKPKAWNHDTARRKYGQTLEDTDIGRLLR